MPHKGCIRYPLYVFHMHYFGLEIESGPLVSVISTLSIFSFPVHPCLICICPGVHTVRVPEDERYLLGADGDGSDGAVAPNEPARDHRLHQILSAWVWRHQRQHWARPPPALHPQRCAGKSKDKQTSDRWQNFFFSYRLQSAACCCFNSQKIFKRIILTFACCPFIVLFCQNILPYQILCLYDSVDAIDVDKVVEYVKGLQQEDGSFAGDKWG